MTASAQNTEFPTVKADLVVSVAERCQTGKELHKAWVQRYKESTMDNWQDVLMKGFEPYLRHFAGCTQCQDYEYLLRGRMLTITEEEKRAE